MDKIYIYNVNTKALHIDGFCSMASKVGNETYKTEEDVIKAKGKNVIMCQNCEAEKERIIQKAVEKLKNK